MKTPSQPKQSVESDSVDQSTTEKIDDAGTPQVAQPKDQKEYGGRKGPEPTRYGDWEKNGIISDF